MKDAEDFLNTAIAKNPNYLEAFNKLAILLMKQDRLDEGLKIWNHLRNSVPHNADYLKSLYASYQKLNSRDNMERYLLKALHLKPFDKEIINDAQEARKTSSNADLKQLELDRIVNKAQNLEDHLQKSENFFNKKDYWQALSSYRKALEMPFGIDQSHQIFFMIGLVYFKLFQLSRAKKFFQLALIRKPRYARAMQALEKIKEKEGFREKKS